MATNSDLGERVAPTAAPCSATVITHGDVDGMVCAAQIIRREQGNCRVLFSNARWIGRKLREVAERAPVPERVYVTDIPANARAVAAVETLSAAGVKVFWIDHHPWPEKARQRLPEVCAKVVYNEAFSTPAGILVGQWLSDEDPYCWEIAQICYAYEKGTPWLRDWFRLLAGQVGRADVDVLQRLAFNRPFTEEDRRRIEQQKEAEAHAARILAEPPRVIKTSDGKTLAVYDTAAMPGVYLGQKVFRHHDVDYSLIRISDRKWQIASNPGRSLRLARLEGDHQVGDLRLAVAGRPKQLLSVEVRGSPLPPDVHERIISWAQGLL